MKRGKNDHNYGENERKWVNREKRELRENRANWVNKKTGELNNVKMREDGKERIKKEKRSGYKK